jgi:MFS family permease
VVGLAKWLPLAVFALPAGALADRMDRKRLMITTDAIRLAGAASIVVALWLGRPPYLQIVLVAFLDGAMFVTSHITERGALKQVVEPEQVQDAVAQNEARYFGASILGPPLGGLLFAAARALPFLLLGAMLAGPLRRRLSPRTVIAGEEWVLLGAVLLLLVVHNALLIGLLVAAAEFSTPIGNLGFQHVGATSTILVVAAWALVLAVAATVAPTLRNGPPPPPAASGRQPEARPALDARLQAATSAITPIHASKRQTTEETVP